MAVSFLDEKRGLFKRLFSFYTTPTVPTVRIVMMGDLPVLEFGKRARLRDNSLVDSVDHKGWDIKGSPIPMIHGKTMEMGYITHPAGCTVGLKTNVKIIAADLEGNPKIEGAAILDENGKKTGNVYEKTEYIEANFEGVVGIDSDLDDFNESTEREQSRGWVIPFILGGVAGVFFFAPLFAWVMSWIAQRAAGL